MKIVALRPSITARTSPGDDFVVRISEDGRKTVVFFGEETDDGFVSRGTGFLVRLQIEQNFFNYIVTCRHIASKLDTGFYIRANTMDGKCDTHEVHDIKWTFPADETVDVAVAALTLPRSKWDVYYLDLSTFRIDPDTDPYLGGIACGDPISIVGLFRLRGGLNRNMPIVHSGHIASLPDPREPIRLRDRVTKKEVEVDAYLVEAQTLEGLSGSPVYVHRFALLPTPGPSGENLAAIGSSGLLGMYQGAWDAKPGEILAADKDFSGQLRVPIGMGLVIPFQKIYETIMGDAELKKTREDKLAKRRTAGAASMDGAFESPPATDANPKHLEDFTRLVDAAARKRPQGDQA